MSDRQVSPSILSTPHIFEQSISAVFENCVLRFGDCVAIRNQGVTLTYNQLNSIANQIAWEILDFHPEAGKPVGLFFRSKPLFLAGLLGVLKTGNFALPIDATFPEAHNRYIAQDSQSSLFLTESELLDQAVRLFPAESSLNIEELATPRSEENVKFQVPADANAILLYTSGSSGKPKGVLHTQRNPLHNAMRQGKLMHIGPDDRLSMLYSCTVHACMRDYMNALTTGASLYPFNIRTQGMGPLLDWITQEELTILHTSPSFFRQLRNAPPRPEHLQSLRIVILGGEICLKSDFDIYRSRFPNHCMLINGLGSTETGTTRLNNLDKSACIQESTVPLGYPVQDVEILLQNEAGNPVPSGEVGEIVVQSPFNAVGYWRRPELNRQVFLPDPEGGDKRLFRTGDLGRFLPDGCLVHCGRKDLQVKIRGFRIELQDVEDALLASGLVQDAVVIGSNIVEGDFRLVAYFVPVPNTGNQAGMMRLALADRLPSYMIPSFFVALEALPRTPAGKVDRQALIPPVIAPEPEHGLNGEVSLETELAHIWEDILSIKLPCVDDDFYMLGGDSLHATSLFLEVEKRFGIRLPLAVLIENNTVRNLAALILSYSTIQNKSLVAIRPQGSKKPVFLLPGGYGDVHYFRNLLKYVEEDRPLYGLQAPSNGSDRIYSMKMEGIASAYLCEILKLQPEGPYYLAGHSFGGYIALEIARILKEQGKKVAFLGLWDTFPPGSRRQPSISDRFMIHCKRLRGLNPRQLLGYLSDRWIYMLVRATKLAPVRSFLTWTNFRPQDAMMATHIIRYGYHPDPYPGNLILFKVGQHPWYIRWDPMENWGKYIQGKLEIREVPGEHGNMLSEPYVKDLARQLNDCLRLADACQA